MDQVSRKPTSVSSNSEQKQKKLMILDSYYSKEKLLVIDLKKIQNNLYDKFCNVYNQFKSEFDMIKRNGGSNLLDGDEADEDESDEDHGASKSVPSKFFGTP